MIGYLSVEYISFGVLLLFVIFCLVVCGYLCMYLYICVCVLVSVMYVCVCVCVFVCVWCCVSDIVCFSCLSVNSICCLDLLSDRVRLAEHVFYMFLLKV